ncbi:MAG: hypothetical protein ACJ74W_10380 [Pyrinomonadaceae bacterium]
MVNLLKAATLPFKFARRRQDDEDGVQEGAVDPQGGLFGRMRNTTVAPQPQPVATLPFTFDPTMRHFTATDGAPTDMPESYAPRAGLPPALQRKPDATEPSDLMRNVVQQFMTLPPTGDDRLTSNDSELAPRRNAPEQLPVNPSNALTLATQAPGVTPPGTSGNRAPTTLAGVRTKGQPPPYINTGDPAGDRQRYLQSLRDFRNPPDENGRVRSGLQEAARMFVENFTRGGLPAAIRGSAVGLVHGLAAPNLDERRTRNEEMGRVQQDDAYDLARQGEQAKLDLSKSQAAENNAQADWLKARPDIEAQKRADTAAQRERGAVLSNLRLLKGQKIDPANPHHAALLQRAADAGVEVDPDSWNEAGSNLVPVDVIDPKSPTTKQRRYYNKTTGELTDAGPTVGYVQPVGADGLTEAQRRGDADRDASRTETHRHNTVTEGQGGTRIAQGAERIGIARDNQSLRGQPTAANTNARLARAAGLQRKLDEEKAKAASPPRSVKGADGSWQPTDDKYRAAYTARHKRNAANYAAQIKNAYSDIYETGEDGDGWSYAKPKVQPNAGAQGGAYAGHRFSRSQLPEIRKRLGVGSDAEAERIITAQGGVFY